MDACVGGGGGGRGEGGGFFFLLTDSRFSCDSLPIRLLSEIKKERTNNFYFSNEHFHITKFTEFLSITQFLS